MNLKWKKAVAMLLFLTMFASGLTAGIASEELPAEQPAHVIQEDLDGQIDVNQDADVMDTIPETPDDVVVSDDAADVDDDQGSLGVKQETEDDETIELEDTLLSEETPEESEDTLTDDKTEEGDASDSDGEQVGDEALADEDDDEIEADVLDNAEANAPKEETLTASLNSMVTALTTSVNSVGVQNNEPVTLTTIQDLIDALESDAVGSYKLSDTFEKGTISKAITVGGSATLDLNGNNLFLGAGISIGKDKSLTLVNSNAADGKIERASSHTGVMVTVEAGGSLTIGEQKADGQTQGNVVLDGGYDEKDKMNALDTIVNVRSGTVTLHDTSVLQNNMISDTKQANGGAIRVEGTNAKLNMKGGLITGNGAMNGGGVSVQGGAVFEMTGGSIVKNSVHKVKKNPSGYAGGKGGGVNVSGAVFRMDGANALIDNNDSVTKGDNGGGIALNTGTIYLINGTISNNMGSYGGGIWTSSAEGSKLVMTGGLVTGNTARMYGGGIEVNSANTMSTISGGTISGNKANFSGGGIDVDGGPVANTGVGLTITGNVTISGNTAGSGAGLSVRGAGRGAVEIDGGENKGVTIINNIAKSNGGGINAAGDGKELTIKNAVITGNEAATGGGIYSTVNNIGGIGATFANLKLQSNKSSSTTGGGAIYSSGSGTVMTNLVVDGNSAMNGYGGGIFTSGANTSLTGITLDSNSSGKNGGGIYSTGDNVEMSDVEARRNSAFQSGAGIYTSGKNAVLTGLTLASNTANEYGGGIYMGGEKSVLKDSSISYNGASMGGGVYTGGLNTELTGLDLQNNNAVKEGGAVYVNAKGITLKGSTLEYNGSPEGKGGAISVSTSGELTVGMDDMGTATLIRNNNADYGGGVYIAGTGSFTLGSGANLYRNSASAAGDDLSADKTASISLIDADTMSTGEHKVTNWFWDKSDPRFSGEEGSPYYKLGDEDAINDPDDNEGWQLKAAAIEEEEPPVPPIPPVPPTPPIVDPTTPDQPTEPVEVELTQASEQALRANLYSIVDYVVPLGAGDSANHGECFE